MRAKRKSLANAFAVVLALVILSVLLLVSSGVDDGLRRSLDRHLVSLRDVAAMIQGEMIAADSLENDVRNSLPELSAEFGTVRISIEQDLRDLLPDDPTVIGAGRQLALGIFNSIDASGQVLASPRTLRARLDVLWADGDQFLSLAQTFAARHGAYLQGRERLQADGRDVVSRLRQQGHETTADSVFALVQQALDRVSRIRFRDTASAENVARRLREVSLPSGELRPQLIELADHVSTLITARLDAAASLGRIADGGFVASVENVRQFVSNDYLFALKTTSDARVLLNVYTLLMLLNLVYFGIRLKNSHAVLGQSHSLLEDRVTERTAELERAYEELKESQVQLVQAEKMSSLGQLVAGIVHEINTPLLYVLNNTRMTHDAVAELNDNFAPVKELVHSLQQHPLPRDELKRLLAQLRESFDVEALDENMEEVLTLTSDSSEGLSDIDTLVKSLKDFSRLDRASYDRFDVRDGLEKTLVITRNMLKYGIEIRREFEEVPEILCAPSRINQVFINLITNAAQAMDGKGTLTLTTSMDDTGMVCIGVADTGCGIAPENVAQVWEPFYTTKPVGQGTGLGLSIVRGIVEDHGGTLSVESEVGVGTRVTVRLPTEGVPQKHAPSPDDVEEVA